MGGGPRPGLATGRARGAPLRLGPQGSGPSAPAPCPSAVEDAGLWERWLTGRKPGGASWLVPETGGAAGTPQTRGRKGGGRSLGRRSRGGRAGARTRSRKPAEQLAEGRRPVGPGVYRDCLGTRPSRRPAAAGRLRAPSPPGRAPRNTIFRPR